MPKNLLMGYIVPLSILLPIGIFAWNYKKSPKSLKYLFYFLLCSGSINLIALLVIRKGMSNLPLLHLYTVVEAVFFLLYFKSIFIQNAVKRWLSALIILFPVICILNAIFLQNIFTFNTYTRPLEAIIITFTCLLYFYKSGFNENWLSSPVNWVNMGVLIYFPAATIIFILSNHFTFVKLNREMVRTVWNIHAILVLVMYLFWARGFTLMKRHNG
jgi:hypothetical protein